MISDSCKRSQLSCFNLGVRYLATRQTNHNSSANMFLQYWSPTLDIRKHILLKEQYALMSVGFWHQSILLFHKLPSSCVATFRKKHIDKGCVPKMLTSEHIALHSKIKLLHGIIFKIMPLQLDSLDIPLRTKWKLTDWTDSLGCYWFQVIYTWADAFGSIPIFVSIDIGYSPNSLKITRNSPKINQIPQLIWSL